MKYLSTLFLMSLIALLVLSDASFALASNSEERRSDHLESLGSLRPLSDDHLRGISERSTEFRDDEIIVKFLGERRPTRVSLQGRPVDEVLAEYATRDDVVYAEPNYIAHAFMVPNDPLYQYQWNFDNAVNGGVHAETAWDITTGNGAVVAVIDTGVAYENYQQSFFTRFYQAPDLAGTRFVAGYDFVNNDTHPNDDNGHGTHVAGTLAGATGNNLGVAGLAYGAKIMPIKVLDRNGSGTYYDVADGIRFAADNGADVINLSLGGSASARYLEDALQYAYNKGVTIVAASGNDGSGSVSYPAAYDAYAIAVGATRFDETRAPYSNYGSALDLVAPGGDANVDQNSDGYGDGILQQTFSGGYNKFNYYFFQGTSMATPHVAAAAALVIANGASTPDEVRSILESSADDLGASGRDNTYGHGLINVALALGTAVNPDPEPEPDPEPVDAAPTISITSPFASSTLNGTVLISTSVSDDQGVGRVEFFIDNTLLGTVHEAPYELQWDTTGSSEGAHTLRAVAYDTADQTGEALIAITVQNVVPEELEVFTESFELGLASWTQDSQRDWFLSTQRAKTGSRSVEVDGRATNAALTSVPLDLSGYTNARVAFSWFIESGFDSGEYVAFDVSTNGGATWIEKGRISGNVSAENTWLTAGVDLTAISSLRLRFRASVSGSSEDANVDAITVTAY